MRVANRSHPAREEMAREAPPTIIPGAGPEPVAERSRVRRRGRLHVFLGA